MKLFITPWEKSRFGNKVVYKRQLLLTPGVSEYNTFFTAGTYRFFKSKRWYFSIGVYSSGRTINYSGYTMSEDKSMAKIDTFLLKRKFTLLSEKQMERYRLFS